MEYSRICKLENAAEKMVRRVPPPAPAEEFDTFYRNEIIFWNEQIDLLEQDFSAKCTCTKGCGHCCRQMITVTRGECIPIEAWLRAASPVVRKEIFTRCTLICNALSEYGLRIDSVIAPDSDYDYILEKYYQLYLFCPFLDQENSCMIYPIRPGVCWSYRSYGAPDLCAQPRGSFGCACFCAFSEAADNRRKAVLQGESSDLLVLPHAVRQILSGMTLE